MTRPSPEQIKYYFEQGYFLAENVFNDEEIAGARQALNEMVSLATELAKKHELPENGFVEHKGALFVLANNGQKVSIKRVVGCGTVDSRLLRMTRDPKLLRYASAFLDAEEFDQIICQFHPKEPGDNVKFDLHRDVWNRKNYDPNWKDISGNGSYVVACIAIDPVTENNGGLQVLPGSNICYDPTKELEQDKTDTGQSNDEGYVTPLLSAGSVLFMHPYLLHRSSSNSSDTSRYTLLGGYSVPGANSTAYPGGRSVHQRINKLGEVTVENLYPSA